MLSLKGDVETEIKWASEEIESLIQSEAEASYIEIGFSIAVGLLTGSFSKSKKAQLDLSEKLHSFNENLVELNKKLLNNAKCIEAKQEYLEEFEKDSKHLLSMDKIVFDVAKDLFDEKKLQLEKIESQFLSLFEELSQKINRPLVNTETVEGAYEEIRNLLMKIEKDKHFFLFKQKEHKTDLSMKERMARIQEQLNAFGLFMNQELSKYDESDIDAIIARSEKVNNIPDVKAYILARESHLSSLGKALADEVSLIKNNLKDVYDDVRSFSGLAFKFQRHEKEILNFFHENLKIVLSGSEKWREIKKELFYIDDSPHVNPAQEGGKHVHLNMKYFSKPDTGFKNQVFINCTFSSINYFKEDFRGCAFVNCKLDEGLPDSRNCKFKDVVIDKTTQMNFNQYGGKILLHNAHLSKELFSSLFVLISRDDLGAKKYQPNASDVLTILREIGSLDISLTEKKTRAKEVLGLMLCGITDLSDLLKFKVLVDTKHLGGENPYAYIREERHNFRAKYGNTETWSQILGAIKIKLQAEASQNTPITDAQYREFHDIMKSRISHTYGLGGIFHSMGGNAEGWKNPVGNLDLAFDQAASDKMKLGQYKK